jgi:hypothetical protein
MNRQANGPGRERGSGLIVIIMIVAFMMAAGMLRPHALSQMRGPDEGRRLPR